MPKKKAQEENGANGAVESSAPSGETTKGANGATNGGTEDTATQDMENNPLFVEPMQLCRPSSCHTFLEVVPETIDALQRVKSGVSVIAGVGSQRIGKSTILNLFHSRRTSGFGLGHTLDAKTHGIWIWLRPHPKVPNTVVVLADTEGLDTPHIQQSYNWMLSALTVIISNVFLYQSKSTIDSSATDRLSTILAVSEQMMGDESSLTRKPTFIWVLRDIQLQMMKDPKTEMMDKLDTLHIRKMKRAFKDFDCFPLPRPVDSEEQLQHVESMKFDELKAGFKDEFFLLDRLVYGHAQTAPTFGNHLVTGEVLCQLVKRYIDAIRDKKGLLANITELPSQASLIAKMAAARALSDGKNSYAKALDALADRFPIRMAKVHEAHLAALAEAEKTLKEACVGVEDEELREVFRELRAFTLEEQPELALSVDAKGGGFGFQSVRRVKGHLLQALAKNEQLATQAAERLFQHRYRSIKEGVEAGGACAYASVSEYDAAVAAMKSELLEEAERAGAGDAMERHFAASKQLSLDREQVARRAEGRQMSALQQEMQQQMGKMRELLEHAIAEGLRKESAERLNLHDLVMKEQLQHNKALSDLKESLGKEISHCTNDIKELSAEVKSGAKETQKLQLDVLSQFGALKESLAAADSKTKDLLHQLEDKMQRSVAALSKEVEGKVSDANKITSAALDTVKKDMAHADVSQSKHLAELRDKLDKILIEMHPKFVAAEKLGAEHAKKIEALGAAVAEADKTVAAAAAAAKEAKAESAGVKGAVDMFSGSLKGAELRMNEMDKSMKELSLRSAESSKLAADAAREALQAKADMEQAANSAILSAMREMEQVYSGEKVLHKGPGGGAPNGAGGGAVGATAPGAGGEHEGSSFGGKMMSFFKNL